MNEAQSGPAGSWWVGRSPDPKDFNPVIGHILGSTADSDATLNAVHVTYDGVIMRHRHSLAYSKLLACLLGYGRNCKRPFYVSTRLDWKFVLKVVLDDVFRVTGDTLNIN